jgi:hypothetical protein
MKYSAEHTVMMIFMLCVMLRLLAKCSYAESYCTKCLCSECNMARVYMLNVIMLNGIILNAFVLRVMYMVSVC